MLRIYKLKQKCKTLKQKQQTKEVNQFELRKITVNEEENRMLPKTERKLVKNDLKSKIAEVNPSYQKHDNVA